jgi:hypothetical protein
MPTDTMRLTLTISAANFERAVRQRAAPYPKASPLALALTDHTPLTLVTYTAEQMTARHVLTGVAYMGRVPPDLAEYMACFARGDEIKDAHVFRLTLNSSD